MKVIDMFAYVATQARDDSHVQKYGYILLARGSAGFAKLNPAVVWLDAAVAVIQSVGSYFNYCSACEATAQLRQCCRVLEVTLAQDLEVGDLQILALNKEREAQREKIEEARARARTQTHISQKALRNQMDLLKRMRSILQNERLRSGGFQELIRLQVCLDSCIDTALALLLSPNGE